MLRLKRVNLPYDIEQMPPTPATCEACSTLDARSMPYWCRWSANDFRDFVNQPWCHGVIATCDNVVIAHMCFVIMRFGRRIDLGVVRLAVDYDFRRQAIATTFINHLHRQFCAVTPRLIACDVPECQEDALMFFSALRFNSTLIRGEQCDFYRFEELST